MAQLKSKIMEIVASSIFAAIVGIAATLYVQDWSQPKVVVKQSWAQYFVFKMQSKVPTIGMIPLDLYDFSAIPFGAIIFEGAGLTKSDWSGSAYFGSIVIENNGKGTANDVRIGVGYEFNGVDFNITKSPNVEIDIVRGYGDKEKAGEVQFPSFFEVKVSSLAPGDIAVINCGWRLRKKNKDNFGTTPMADMVIQGEEKLSSFESEFYLPKVIFATSKETMGTVEGITSFIKIRSLVRPNMVPFMWTSSPVITAARGSYKARQFKYEDEALKDEKTGITFLLK